AEKKMGRFALDRGLLFPTRSAFSPMIPPSDLAARRSTPNRFELYSPMIEASPSPHEPVLPSGSGEFGVEPVNLNLEFPVQNQLRPVARSGATAPPCSRADRSP